MAEFSALAVEAVVAVVAEPADVAVVAVAALPLILMLHVPDAPPPVVVAYELVSSVQVSVAVFFSWPASAGWHGSCAE